MNTKSIIEIFRGDDSDALGYQTIVGTIHTDLDLTGCKAVFRYLGFFQEFDPIPEDGKLTIVIPSASSMQFPPGFGYASLKVYDIDRKVRTFTNRIPVFVKTMTPCRGGGEFDVEFSPFPELEPLKIFIGPNADDFDQYTGFLTKTIDRASAQKYGLSMLFDAMDAEKTAKGGCAASPAAVKAAYDAVIGVLTDNYYTKTQTDEAIDKLAAYYITADAQGNPFATHAALVNATTYYSGGSVRTPTRNDYAIVVADETHNNEEWRYIYSENEQGVGQWEPQYAVEGVITFDDNVTRTSANGVKSSGIWSAIWGALSALPTGFASLYDWVVDQLADKEDIFTPAQISAQGVQSVFAQVKDGTTIYETTIPTTIMLPSPSTSTPAMDGTGSAGSASAYSRGDHVHPTDTSRMAANATGADIAVSGTDATKINAALAGKLDKSGGTVTGDLVMSLTNIGKGLALTKNSALGNLDWRLFVDSSNRLAFYSLGDWYTATLRRRAGTIAFLDEIGITAFDATATYAVGAKVVYDNAVWNCTTAVSTAGAWSTVGSNFTKLFDLDTGAPASGGTKLITNGQAFTVLQGKADVSAIPYSLVTQPIVGNGVILDDRASNAVTISTTLSPNTLTINFPTATSGKVRDFAMRLNIAAGVTAPEIAWPQGVTLENDGGEVPEIADGGTGGSSTILYFSETENDGTTAKFLVKGETLTAIAQA